MASGLTRNQEQIAENDEESRASGNWETCGRLAAALAAVAPVDPDLLVVAQRWSQLSPTIKAAILTMVNAVVPDARLIG